METLSVHDRAQVLVERFTPNYLKSIFQKSCEVTSEETEAQSGWPQGGTARKSQRRNLNPDLLHNTRLGMELARSRPLLQLHILSPCNAWIHTLRA